MIAHPNDAACLRVLHGESLRRPCSLYAFGLKIGDRIVGPCKVGIASRPLARRAILQTGCPWPIVPLMQIRFPTRGTAVEFEAYFHDCYRHLSTNGEWFDLKPEETLRRIQWRLTDYLCAKRIIVDLHDAYTEGWGCSDDDFDAAIARIPLAPDEVRA